jgi:transposase
MSLPVQSVARIAEELGIHLVTLFNWRKGWRLQGEMVPASEKAHVAIADATRLAYVEVIAGRKAGNDC